MILYAFISINDLKIDQHHDEVLKMLSPGDFEAYQNFMHNKDRRLYLAARILVWRLAKKINPAFKLSDMSYSRYGKPGWGDRLDIGITHSGDYCAAAVSNDCNIGIDLQEYQDIDAGTFSILPGNISEEENNLPPNRPAFEKWAIMEAIMKADGRGFHLDRDKIELRGNVYLVKDTGKKYYLYPMPHIPGYAFVLLSDQADVTCNRMDGEQWLA